MTKKLNMTLLALITIGSLAWAAGSGEIKIGVAGAQSGDLAAYGIPTLRAAQIVVDQVNASGGIGGVTLQIVPGDDVCDPAQATNVAARLVGEGVVAVVGHICSGATISAMPIYGDANIPVISSSATSPDLTLSGQYPTFFRTIAHDAVQSSVQSEFLINVLKVNTVAILHDKGDYGKGLAENAKRELEQAGVAVSVFEGITPGAADYSAVVNKIISESVDAVVFGGYHPEGSKLITQLRDRGYQNAFISGDGLQGQEFINLAGSYAEGVYASGPRDYSGTELYETALAQHQEKFGEDPGAFYYEGYAAILSIIEAIKAGNTTSDDALAYLRSGATIDTPVGTIKYDSNGDAEGVGFAIYQVRNGVYQLVQ